MIHKQEKRQFKKEKKRPRGRQRQDFITVIQYLRTKSCMKIMRRDMI